MYISLCFLSSRIRYRSRIFLAAPVYFPQAAPAPRGKKHAAPPGSGSSALVISIFFFVEKKGKGKEYYIFNRNVIFTLFKTIFIRSLKYANSSIITLYKTEWQSGININSIPWQAFQLE